MMPFVTEALWPHVEASGPAGIDGVTLPPSRDDVGLAGAAWPDIACRIHDDAAVTEFTRLQELTNAIRTLRGDHRVAPKRKIELHVTPPIAALIESGGGVVETLAGLAAVTLRTAERPAGSIPIAFEGEELLASGLVDAVDLDAERARLEQLVATKAKAVGGFEGKLSNAGYVNNAPPAVVEETRRRLAEAAADLEAARAALAALV
jgi:valyl-tRNA synthetase